MRVKSEEDQGTATGSNISDNLSNVRVRRGNEINIDESQKDEVESFIEKHIPQHVLVKMEAIYNQINDFSQKAVVCSKEIYESARKIPKPTLALLALTGLLSLYITSMILSAIYFPATDIICKVTPYSDSVFSFCKSTIPNFTAMVDAQVEAQERLLKQSAELDSEGSLAHDIKKAELATKDLMLLVKYSNLHYKAILVKKLKDFSDASFEANKDLQNLQVRAQTSLDNTLTYISYTLKTIEEFSGKVISPRQERDLNRLHDTLMKLTDDDLRKLIYATDHALKSLKKLDVMQDTIHDITAQEEKLQTIGHEELLAGLWSILGGNKVERSIFKNNLKLLKSLDNQRKVAVERIALIMEYLEKFQKQLDVLREETVTRLLVEIPVEVHLTNIKKALMRLQNNEITSGIKINKKISSGSNIGQNKDQHHQHTSTIY